MPEPTGDASRDERLAALFSSLQNFPQLGKVGQQDFDTLGREFILMKLYAIQLEDKLKEALALLAELVLPTPEEETLDATEVPEEDHHHG